MKLENWLGVTLIGGVALGAFVLYQKAKGITNPLEALSPSNIIEEFKATPKVLPQVAPLTQNLPTIAAGSPVALTPEGKITLISGSAKLTKSSGGSSIRSTGMSAADYKMAQAAAIKSTTTPDKLQNIVNRATIPANVKVYDNLGKNIKTPSQMVDTYRKNTQTPTFLKLK